MTQQTYFCEIPSMGMTLELQFFCCLKIFKNGQGQKGYPKKNVVDLPYS